MLPAIILAAFLAPQEIVIVVNDELSSKRLIYDLSVDWCNPILHDDSVNYEDLRYLQYVQDTIKQYSTIIKNDDIQQLFKYKVDRVLKQYPAFKLNRYDKEIEIFPEDTISEPSFSMLYLKKCIDEYYDYEAEFRWHRACERAEWQRDVEYTSNIFTWLTNNKINDYTYSADDYILDTKYYEDKYKDTADFPKRQAASYPPKPTYSVPWAEDYSFSPFPDLSIGKKPEWIR